MPSSTSYFLESITVIPVTNIELAIEWYERNLQLTPVYIKSGLEPANYAVSTRDRIQVHFILDEDPETKSWTNSGTAYLYIKSDNVIQEYKNIQTKDVTFIQHLAKATWGLMGFVLQDPFGNIIRIEESN
jgi:uncharacterized glyoxalase superfamily protein PhnB